MYATPDNAMVARMLHLPSDKNKIYNEQSQQSVIQRMSEYEINIRTTDDILDQICEDTDLYPYVKQHKSKWDGTGHFMPSTPGVWAQTILM